MDSKFRTRLAKIAGPLSCTLMLLSITLMANPAQAAVPTYTGCYSPSSGTINKLAIGSNPQKNCNTGDIIVSFSAGDITKISVTGGLTGGGENGDITISLDPKYSLPQSCAANQVAKWNGTSWLCANDEDTTYSAGTGLNLSGSSNAFSIAATYRLPQSCTDGSFPKLSGGSWICAAESAGPEVWLTTTGRKDIGDDATATVASLTLPAGSYVLHATATAARDDTSFDTLWMGCHLSSGATMYSQFVTGSVVDDALFAPLVISAVITLDATRTVDFKCQSGEAGQHVDDATFVAVKAGTVHVQ